MSWIQQFARNKPKPPDYAERTLKAYRMGIKAGGSIRGVRVLVSEDSCPTCRALAESTYTPDNAPVLPLAGCTHPTGCRCAYTLVMHAEPGPRLVGGHTHGSNSGGAASKEF